MNHRHADFQSAALPTELSGHYRFLRNLRFFESAGECSAPEVSGVIAACSAMASAQSNFFDSFSSTHFEVLKSVKTKKARNAVLLAFLLKIGALRFPKPYCFDPAVRPRAKGTAATISAIIGDDAKIRLAREVMATERTTGSQFGVSLEFERECVFLDALNFSTSRRTSSRSRRSSEI